MRHAKKKEVRTNKFFGRVIPGLLAFSFMALAPAQVIADEVEVCNKLLQIVSYTGNNGTPFFPDDEITLRVQVGANRIVDNETDNPWLDVDGFGYALDCQDSTISGLSECVSKGHDITFLGVPDTTCVNADGEKTEFDVFEANIIPVPVKNGAIRSYTDERCTMDLRFRINAMTEGSTTIRQGVGYPFDDYGAACSNGIEPTAFTTVKIPVESCGIEVSKQVSVDGGETWFEADDLESAPDQMLGKGAEYKLVLTNTGSASYPKPISIVDTLLGIDTTVAGPAPGSSIDITKLVPGFANLDQPAFCKEVGEIMNQVNVSASCRDDDSVTATALNQAYLDCVGNPSIKVEKGTSVTGAEGVYEDSDAAPGSMVLSGAPVYWNYIVTNDGDLDLENVTVVDDQGVVVDCGGNTSLIAGASFTCTASGTAISGQYANIGTATGTPPGGTPVNDSDPSHYFGATPAINIVKAADPMTYDDDEDTIAYTFVVTNIGNVVLNGVVVTDTKAGPVTCGPWPDVGAPGTLLPTEFVACAADSPYPVSQADIDAGEIVNVATATGTPPVGPPVQDDDDETVTAVQRPEIDIVKTATPTTYSNEGDKIAYTFVVTNIGNVTLTGVAVEDLKVGPVSCGPWPDADGVLMPTESVNCAADELYSIEAADVIAGFFDNTATTSGTDPNGNVVTDEDTETVTATGRPAIEIVKTADPTIYKELDEPILYTFVVRNTGTLDLSNVVVTDPDIPGAITCVWPGTDGVLLVVDGVGQSATCTAPYMITQADLDNGEKLNTARVDGTALTDDGEQNVFDEDDAKITSTAAPSIDLRKEINLTDPLDPDEWKDANDAGTAPEAKYPASARYRIIITNDGPLTLTDLVVNDAELGIVAYTIAGDLAPLGTVTITEDELDKLGYAEVCDRSGTFINTADVAAETTVTEEPVTASDAATLKCVGEPAIEIKKEIRANPDDEWSLEVTPPQPVPSDAEYRITVKNTGTVDLENVVVTDNDLPGFGDYDVGNLAMGQEVVLEWDPLCPDVAPSESPLCALKVSPRCTEAGRIPNTASVIGDSTEEGNEEVTDSDTAYLYCVGQPLIELEKQISLNNEEWFDADTEITALTAVVPDGGTVSVFYRLIVTNTGPVDLTNVTFEDGQLGIDELDYVIDSLPSGGTVTVTNGEIPALSYPDRCSGSGAFANTATATGDSAETGAPVSSGDSAWLVCTGKPEIEIVKEIGVCEVESDIGGACEYKPRWLDFTYVSAPCVPGTNAQDAVCEDGGVGPGSPAGFITEGHNNAEWSPDSGVFENGSTYRFQAADDKWPNQLTLDIGEGAQIIDIHTSCSEPLVIGDVFGSLELVGMNSDALGDSMSDDDSDGDYECRVHGKGGTINWYDDLTPGQQPPADAWYRITVRNIGTSDLVDVIVLDEDLLLDYGIDLLPVGEEVVLDSSGPTDDVAELMYWPQRCEAKGEYINKASAEGISDEVPFEEVMDMDTATLVCDDVDICLFGKPKTLFVEYDGDPDTDNSQDVNAVSIDPENPLFPLGPVDILVLDPDKPKAAGQIANFQDVGIGDELRISGNKYRKASRLKFEIYDVTERCDDDSDVKSYDDRSRKDVDYNKLETSKGGDSSSYDRCKVEKELIQEIIFSVDCDEPLIIGDEFGAITITD